MTLSRNLAAPAGGRVDRALGALAGLAVGDAYGMPTQGLPRTRAAAVLRGPGDPDRPRLVDAPSDNPIAPGLPAGTTTDDTAQALLLARLLVDGAGQVDPWAMADRFLAWECEVRARGSLDLLGPSTRSALEAVAAGADPTTTGATGASDGAAMRVAPVGIATPLEPLGRLVDRVVAADRVTHDTTVAHAGACAVAAAVSAGVAGHGFETALALAITAAALGARRGHRVDRPDVAARIAAAVRLVRRAAGDGDGDGDVEPALDLLVRRVGAGLATEQAVPAAFAVAALAPGDPGVAALLGARLGDDADTIAAMAGAVVGSCTGASALPAGDLATVLAVNRLDLAGPAAALLRLRDQPDRPPHPPDRPPEPQEAR